MSRNFARRHYGMEIVDVELVHITLPEQNREHVFERMKAERGKMAKEFRTAGECNREEDHRRGRPRAHPNRGRSVRSVQRIKAEGDAEATRIYAAAFGRNPSFYKFLRTLQAYEKLLDENTTLFLPADADVLRLLAQPRQVGPAIADRRANGRTAKSTPIPHLPVSLARPQ